MCVFIWGRGSKGQTLGAMGREVCGNCGQQATVYLGVVKKRITVYWVPVAQWKSTYYLFCGVCNAAAELPKEKGKMLEGMLHYAASVPPTAPGQVVSVEARELPDDTPPPL